MRSLDRFLLAQVLPRLLSSACPSTVPRSGAAGAQVNCFTTSIRNGDGPYLVLLRLAEDKVEALQFDGTKCAVETVVPLADIDPSTLCVTHYYGHDEVRYEGIWAVVPGLWTRWPYARIHAQRLWNALAQRLFNRRTLASRRRLDMLRDVVDATANGAEAVSALDLMSARYGYRWASHPEWESHHQLLERQLELLADSGDLRKCDYRFQPRGQALKTLEESEEADRKHKANFRVQVLLAVLTLVSAAMAAAQAGLVKLPTLLDLTSSVPSISAAPARSLPITGLPPTSTSTSDAALSMSSQASLPAARPPGISEEERPKTD